MKTKIAAILCFSLFSISGFGQLKIVKLGVKGGINYPQTALSLDDVNQIINDQTYDISNIQTDISNGFNAGVIARVSLPLLPVYVHGEALYTQFDQDITMIDNGNTVDLGSTVQRLDFPISAGAKLGPVFAGVGATPSIPLANASDIWSSDTQPSFTWGWHAHAGVKVWRLLGEIKYESGFGMLAGAVDYDVNGTTYDFNLDSRSSQLVVSVAYFFK